MTLQQIRYIITIAETKSMNEASKRLFIAQPSLSSALKELENEIGITIFSRTNKGVILTSEGQEFLTYARQIIDQFSLLEEKYINNKDIKKKFGVSTQHYSFVVKAFVDMVKNFDMNEYEFAIRETKTSDVITDVSLGRSEVGILYINNFNQKVLNKIFKENNVEFNSLFKCKGYIYLCKDHPLANSSKLTIEDLADYPCLSFEQGDNNSFYYAEEILSTYDYKKIIKACDRATMLNLMVGLNAYTLCSGVICEELNGNNFRAIPLEDDVIMNIGYITKNYFNLSDIGEIYIKKLKEYIGLVQK